MIVFPASMTMTKLDVTYSATVWESTGGVATYSATHRQ